MKTERFHVVLQVPLGGAQALEEALHSLQHADPPLRRVQLRLEQGDDALFVLLGYDDAHSFTVQHSRVGALAVGLSAKVIDLEHLSVEGRAHFEARVDELPLLATAEGDLRPVFVELRRHQPGLVLRVSFDSEEALLAAWVRHVAEGALWVPTGRGTDAEAFNVIFVTPGGDYPDNHGLRVRRTPPPGGHGLWLELHPGPPLAALLSQAASALRDSRSSRALRVPLERIESDLDVHIEDLNELAAQFTADISRGGLFVATPRPPALRTRLRLHLTLPNGEVLTLPAEVVHRVMTGPRVGVGLQFFDLKPGLFAPIEALLAPPRHRPRVLVVDDEAIWRSTLARVLHALDAEVILASDGREGMARLTDEYFDLDLVILDLHMPHLDGQGLLDRVRRLGGDTAFKIFLFSAAPRTELAALGAPGLATRVFSKLDPLDVLAAQLARELGRAWPPKEPAVAA